MRRSPRDTAAARRAELAAALDYTEHAKRLATFKAATDGKVWRYQEDRGEWWLVPVYDGTVSLPELTR
jgi:hypothetical protein